jgi:hypothetical protein
MPKSGPYEDSQNISHRLSYRCITARSASANPCTLTAVVARLLLVSMLPTNLQTRVTRTCLGIVVLEIIPAHVLHLLKEHIGTLCDVVDFFFLDVGDEMLVIIIILVVVVVYLLGGCLLCALRRRHIVTNLCATLAGRSGRGGGLGDAFLGGGRTGSSEAFAKQLQLAFDVAKGNGGRAGSIAGEGGKFGHVDLGRVSWRIDGHTQCT